jgi:hypothetical protein
MSYWTTAVSGATAVCKVVAALRAAALGAVALGVAALGAVALEEAALRAAVLRAAVLGAAALGAAAPGVAVLGAAALAIWSCGEKEGEGIVWGSFSQIPMQSATSSACYAYTGCSCDHLEHTERAQRGKRRKNTVCNNATSNNLKGKPMAKTTGLHWLQQATKHVPMTDRVSIHRA